MKTVFIYSLSTLEHPGDIRYIGKTDNVSKRLSRHLQPSYLKEGTYKANWLISELKKGNTPTINIVDEVPESEWAFWEIYWIAQFKSWGFRLTNGTNGGEGVKLSADALKIRSKAVFDKTTIRLSDDLIKFNIHQKEDLWTAERNCIKCNSIIYYKKKSRYLIFSAINRDERENRCCVNCDYKSRLGSGNSFFGKTHTPELQDFLRNIAPKKKVLMLSLDNNILEEFNSVREAALQTKISRRGISGCCNNLKNYNTAGGFKWKFKV